MKKLVLLGLLGLVGCASNSDMEALRADIAQLKADLVIAEKNAQNDAADKAAKAKAAAEAKAQAAEANAVSKLQALEAKLDKLFKKSQYK